ncbi:hypothetical protein [Metabacillus niabensis]|uniref:hypothetical protein n=1 Tax=Metabacillus niabensis TaxID=324854 RepID=UPI001CFB6CAC|nr:hypothetical protein [Metabacillus niabensis]
MKSKFLILFLLVVFAFGAVSPSFASASEDMVSKSPLTDEEITSSGDYVVNVSISDEQLNLALEIAESNLEESTVINKDGTIKLEINNAKKANVSQKAFKAYKKFIKEANAQIKEGEIVASLLPETNLITFKEKDSIVESEISPMFTVIGSGFYKLTNSDVAKLKKVIAYGGGAASLAAALKLNVKVAAVVAAGAIYLNASIDLCNWNDKGIYMKRTMLTPPPTGSWTCWPVL